MSRKTLKWLGLAALAAIIVAGAGAVYWRQQAAQADAYTTVKVTRGDIRDTVSALGTLVPSQYVDVGAQVSGQLIELPVKLGDTVKQGQLVGVIDPTPYTAKVAQDRAQIADLQCLSIRRWGGAGTSPNDEDLAEAKR